VKYIPQLPPSSEMMLPPLDVSDVVRSRRLQFAGPLMFVLNATIVFSTV